MEIKESLTISSNSKYCSGSKQYKVAKSVQIHAEIPGNTRQERMKISLHTAKMWMSGRLVRIQMQGNPLTRLHKQPIASNNKFLSDKECTKSYSYMVLTQLASGLMCLKLYRYRAILKCTFIFKTFPCTFVH